MSERRLLKLARLVLSVSFVVVCQLGQRWIQFLLKVCQSIPSLWSHLVSVCLLHRLQRSSSATQRKVCLRATVEKKNKKDTYVHESLILNANTVTCKHVFSVAFQSSLLLFSRRTACVRLRKSTSALALRVSSLLLRKAGSCAAYGKAKQKFFRGETTDYQTQNASG